MRAGELFDQVGRRRWPAVIVLILSGALAALGHAPVSLPPATILGLVIAVRLLAVSGSWQMAVWRGWCFAAGYFAVAMFWLVEPFLVYPLRHGWMAPFALMAMAGGLALFWSAAFGAAFAAGYGAASRAVALALTVTGAEALREILFTGFPWGLPGYVWSATPVAQAGAYIGPLGLTFLTVLSAAAFARSRHMPAGALAVIVGIAAVWVAGEARMRQVSSAAGPRPLVRLVQPNIDQQLKWHPAHARGFYARLLELSAARQPEQPDVIVWPETAATFLLVDEDARLAEIAAAGGGRVILGIRRDQDDRIFNSMAVLGPGGAVEDHYDKRKLVPFGEYVPFGDLLARFGMSGLATGRSGGFSAGIEPAILEVPPVGRVLAIICYEAIFWSALRREDRPDAMLQITNDAWFGTYSGPQQHFEQARMRAIELGLPLIRSANTGISAVIDGRGNVAGKIALGRQGFLDIRLPERLPPTMFARFGHLPLLAAALLMAGLLGWRRAVIRR